jgi:hypothetical protein
MIGAGESIGDIIMEEEQAARTYLQSRLLLRPSVPMMCLHSLHVTFRRVSYCASFTRQVHNTLGGSILSPVRRLCDSGMCPL